MFGPSPLLELFVLNQLSALPILWVMLMGGCMYSSRVTFLRVAGGVLWLLCSVASWADYSPLGVTGAKTVNAFEAKALFDRDAIFIDVRNKEEWQVGHIEGAIHLDFQNDFAKLYRAKGVERETPIVLYCSSTNCLRSAYAAAVSVYWGFSNVYYFRSGFFAWMLEDYPVVLSQVALNID